MPRLGDLAANPPVTRNASSTSAAPVIRNSTQQDMSDMPLPVSTGIATGTCTPASRDTAGVVDGGPGMSIEVVSVAVALWPAGAMAIGSEPPAS